MIELPPEIIWVIAENLNFRSLCSLRLACKNYSDLLYNLVESRKRKLFAKYTLIDKDNSIIFKPGPAITTLPKNFPINGIYFFEIVEYDMNSCLSLGMNNEDIDYCLHGEINFFFQDFNRMLRNCYDTKCIATIKTKRKQVHNHDLGCHSVNFSKHKALEHWNDLDGDYRDLFQKAKLVIKKFWKNL